MKKITTLCLLLFALASTQTAFSQIFKEGSAVFSAGVGIGNLSKGLIPATFNAPSEGTTYSSVGPLFLKSEFCVSQNFGVGLNIAHVGVGAKWNNGDYYYKNGWRSTSFLFRMNGYIVNTDNFLLYTGLGIGFKTGGRNSRSNDPNYTFEKTKPFIPIGLETTLGMRVRMTDHFAAYGELGIAKGILQCGLSYTL